MQTNISHKLHESAKMDITAHLHVYTGSIYTDATPLNLYLHHIVFGAAISPILSSAPLNVPAHAKPSTKLFL